MSAEDYKRGTKLYDAYWEGVLAGGDLAKDAVWWVLEPLRQAGEYNAEVEEIWAQVKWIFEEK